jgi:hypothetical protein
MDSETFMMMGFMVLPMLFIMFGLMQRMQGRRRELPAPPVSHAPGESVLRALPVLLHSQQPPLSPRCKVMSAHCPAHPLDALDVQGKPARDGADRDQGPPTPPVD